MPTLLNQSGSCISMDIRLVRSKYFTYFYFLTKIASFIPYSRMAAAETPVGKRRYLKIILF